MDFKETNNSQYGQDKRAHDFDFKNRINHISKTPSFFSSIGVNGSALNRW